jgi:hypothetical protein
MAVRLSPLRAGRRYSFMLEIESSPGCQKTEGNWEGPDRDGWKI